MLSQKDADAATPLQDKQIYYDDNSSTKQQEATLRGGREGNRPTLFLII